MVKSDYGSGTQNDYLGLVRQRLQAIQTAKESGGLEREVMHDLIQLGLEISHFENSGDYFEALQNALPGILGFGLRKIGCHKVE